MFQHFFLLLRLHCLTATKKHYIGKLQAKTVTATLIPWQGGYILWAPENVGVVGKDGDTVDVKGHQSKAEKTHKLLCFMGKEHFLGLRSWVRICMCVCVCVHMWVQFKYVHIRGIMENSKYTMFIYRTVVVWSLFIHCTFHLCFCISAWWRATEFTWNAAKILYSTMSGPIEQFTLTVLRRGSWHLARASTPCDCLHTTHYCLDNATAVGNRERDGGCSCESVKCEEGGEKGVWV